MCRKSEATQDVAGTKKLSRFLAALKPSPRSRDAIILAAIFLFHVVFNIVWISQDSTPPGVDEGEFMTASVKYGDVMRNPSPSSIQDYLLVYRKKPALHSMIGGFFNIASNNSEMFLYTVILIYTAVLLISVYGIGRKLYNRNVGLLSAFLVSTFPIVSGHCRSFLSDYPNTAVTSATLLFLLLSQGFKNRRYALLFGFTVGLGMLTKVMYPLFVLGPFLYVLWKHEIITWSRVKALSERIKGLPTAFLNVLISGGIFGAFLWMVFKVFWNYDPRVSLTWAYALTSLCAVLFILLWLIISLTIYEYTKSHGKVFKDILRKHGDTYISNWLLIFFLLPQVRDIPGAALYIGLVSFALFLLLNYISFKEHFGIIWSERGEKSRRINPWLNLVLGGIVWIITVGWWYIPNSVKMVPLYLSAAQPAAIGAEAHAPSLNVFSPESILHYILLMPNQQIMAFFYVLLIAVVIYIIKKRGIVKKCVRRPSRARLLRVLNFLREDKKHLVFLLVWIGAAYLLHVLILIKLSRYMIPYLPAVAILLALFLLNLKNKHVRYIAVIGVILLSFTQMFVFAYEIEGYPEHVTFDTPFGAMLLYGDEPFGPYIAFDTQPSNADWRAEEILRFIYNDSKERDIDPKARIGIIAHSSPFHPYYLEYHVFRAELPVELLSPPLIWPPERFYEEFGTLNYLIVQENLTEYKAWAEEAYRFFSFFLEHTNWFSHIRSYTLPDGSTAEIYVRNP